MRMDESDANTTKNDTHPSWQPIRLRDVEQGEAGIPVVDDLIYKGGVTLLSAREKAGKTTAINLLAQKLYADRPSTFLGLAVHRSKVLFVSEETALTWIPRREDSEAPPDISGRERGPREGCYRTCGFVLPCSSVFSRLEALLFTPKSQDRRRRERRRCSLDAVCASLQTVLGVTWSSSACG